MHTALDHEKLEVYQASLEFITWTIPFLDRLPGNASLRNQAGSRLNIGSFKYRGRKWQVHVT